VFQQQEEKMSIVR